MLEGLDVAVVLCKTKKNTKKVIDPNKIGILNFYHIAKFQNVPTISGKLSLLHARLVHVTHCFSDTGRIHVLILKCSLSMPNKLKNKRIVADFGKVKWLCGQPCLSPYCRRF